MNQTWVLYTYTLLLLVRDKILKKSAGAGIKLGRADFLRILKHCKNKYTTFMYNDYSWKVKFVLLQSSRHAPKDQIITLIQKSVDFLDLILEERYDGFTYGDGYRQTIWKSCTSLNGCFPPIRVCFIFTLKEYIFIKNFIYLLLHSF